MTCLMMENCLQSVNSRMGVDELQPRSSYSTFLFAALWSTFFSIPILSTYTMFASQMEQLGLLFLFNYTWIHRIMSVSIFFLPPYAREEEKPFGPSWIQTHITCLTSFCSGLLYPVDHGLLGKTFHYEVIKGFEFQSRSQKKIKTSIRILQFVVTFTMRL